MYNNKLSRKKYDSPPRSMMKKQKNYIRRTYILLNIFLWLQGIGFTRGIRCDGKNILTTLASIFLLIIQDGNFIYLAYVYCRQVRKMGAFESKAELATIIIGAMNLALRFLFYTRRKLLRDNIKKLENLYAKTYGEDNRKCMFKLKLTSFVVINKALPIIHLYYSLRNIEPNMAENYSYGIIPPPYALPCVSISISLNSIGFVDLAVSVYFWIVCFALKEVLHKYRKRLVHDQSDQYLERYCKITDVITHFNNLLHPFLVITFMSILTTVFRETYYAVFESEAVEAMFNIFNAIFSFMQLMVICVSSSSVIHAVEEIKSFGKNLPLNITKPKQLRFILQINDGLVGFKVLNSIVIDLSLIPHFIGALLTYGILIASFNAKSSGAD